MSNYEMEYFAKPRRVGDYRNASFDHSSRYLMFASSARPYKAEDTAFINEIKTGTPDFLQKKVSHWVFAFIASGSNASLSFCGAQS